MARIENRLKYYLLSVMGRRWHAQSHEDRYSTGIPDLSYGANGVNGWIELKQVQLEKPHHIIKPSKFTASQVNWLKNRNAHGGYCYVLVKVNDSYFLFDAEHARAIADGQHIDWYYTNSRQYWHKQIAADEFLNEICGG